MFPTAITFLLFLSLLLLPNSTSTPVRMPSSSTPCASGITHTLELAVAYDSTFCALHFNSPNIASAYVQSVVNDASRIYSRDTCIALALVHLDPHCNPATDPYRPIVSPPRPTSDPEVNDIVASFRTVWNQSPARASVRRDVAVFFSGFEDGTSALGAAYLNGVCQDDAFAWIERGTLETFVHELGHTLSATHTLSGIMNAGVRPGNPIFFSDTSVQQIETYIDNNGDAAKRGKRSAQEDATCLDTTPPVCDATCPGACLNGNCVTRYSASAPARFVPCSPLRLRFRCVVEEEGRLFGVDCGSGVQFVQRARAGEDVFCCTAPNRQVNADIITVSTLFQQFTFANGTQSRDLIPTSDEGKIMEGSSLIDSSLVPDCGGSSGATTAPPPVTTTAGQGKGGGKGNGKGKK